MLPKGFEGVKAIKKFVVDSIFIHRFQRYPLQDCFFFFWIYVGMQNFFEIYICSLLAHKTKTHFLFALNSRSLTTMQVINIPMQNASIS